MSAHGVHVHGPHDHELQHAQQGGQGAQRGHGSENGGMVNQIARFVAGAIGLAVGALA